MFDIHAMAHRPKPDPVSYANFCTTFDVRPTTALFVEDSVHNLEPAHAMGMTTIWINHSSDGEAGGTDRPAYVDHEITDLSDWLHEITGEFA
jgi:putative hydrolase of the HAD superfamily